VDQKKSNTEQYQSDFGNVSFEIYFQHFYIPPIQIYQIFRPKGQTIIYHYFRWNGRDYYIQNVYSSTFFRDFVVGFWRGFVGGCFLGMRIGFACVVLHRRQGCKTRLTFNCCKLRIQVVLGGLVCRFALLLKGFLRYWSHVYGHCRVNGYS